MTPDGRHLLFSFGVNAANSGIDRLLLDHEHRVETVLRAASVLATPGWLLKLDPATGAVLGSFDVTDGHGVAALDSGEPMVTGPDGATLWWFRPIP